MTEKWEHAQRMADELAVAVAASTAVHEVLDHVRELAEQKAAVAIECEKRAVDALAAAKAEDAAT